MSAPAPVVEREGDDEILAYSHQLRKKIVRDITDNGTKVPLDDKVRMTALIQTLDGMDRQALGNKRIKVEEKAGQSREQMAGTIAQLLQQVTGHRPFEVVEVEAREAPTLPAEVPPPRLAEGETATVAPQQDYDTFMAQNSPLTSAASDAAA